MLQPQTLESSSLIKNGAQQYSELLVAEKTRVQSELRGPLEVLQSGRIAVEDQAPILHEQFVSIRHNNFAYEKIKAIDAALERLKRGEYGICEECDEPISAKRLRAVPWTRYCLHCQEHLADDSGAPVFRHLKAA